jgi:hypothetical protein
MMFFDCDQCDCGKVTGDVLLDHRFMVSVEPLVSGNDPWSRITMSTGQSYRVVGSLDDIFNRIERGR